MSFLLNKVRIVKPLLCGKYSTVKGLIAARSDTSLSPVVHFFVCFSHFRPTFWRNCSSGACDACWRAGPWRPCTSACGQGFQSRKVDCVHTRSCKTVAERRCEPGKKPSSWRHCLGPSCDSTYPLSGTATTPQPCANRTVWSQPCQGLVRRAVLNGCGILGHQISCFDVGATWCSLEKKTVD